MEKLAILGGTPAVQNPPAELFRWPIITKEDEEFALKVIRENLFSLTEITAEFEEKFAAWQGRKYALGFSSGTMSLAAAMFAIGLGAGDEIICTTKTYWASIVQALNFGAVPVFCNIDDQLSMDPDDLERCITPKTKAIMVVHYLAYPADMDRIMAIAEKHNLIVIEDCSHAHGALYKGRKVGTFGKVAAMSMMSGKSFAAGEMGMLVTDDRKVYERAIGYGHYNMFNDEFIKESEDLKPYYNIAMGGVKGRVNQLCSALALGQLKYYDERIAEIDKAMNYFWDQLEGLPGIRPIRPAKDSGSTMGGWYAANGMYYADQLHGLSPKRFCDALRAEGFLTYEGGNYCLHTHPLFQTADLLHAGKPTRIMFADRDPRPDDKLCDKSLERQCFSVPVFRHFDKEWIDRYVAAVRKVIDNHEQLLENDVAGAQGGRWHGHENH